ncbi:aminotransferase class I/II-fold pyridoxal phosphate-dependent enzyme [Paenibacillus sp. CAU 1782]
MAKIKAPLYEALVRHRDGNPVSFHVPGHHGGRAFQYGIENGLKSVEGLQDLFLNVMDIDLTELSSTDDLHHPEACIAESQQLAAETFGSDETLFLVGGSTAGNIGMLLAACGTGDLVLVQRNVHKSVIHGLKLAGAKAVFLNPEYERTSALATVPSTELVEAAIDQYPDAKAVFLSNPNYYGMGVDLASYAKICHDHGIPLLVDEAHGAHYGLHPEFPGSAIAAGADAVIQSAHKTLPALTMGAMLHLQGDYLNRGKLKQYLSMIQSSSPSFPIMASLDISRAMIDAAGPALFQSAIDAAKKFKRWLQEQAGMIRAYEPRVQEEQVRTRALPAQEELTRTSESSTQAGLARMSELLAQEELVRTNALLAQEELANTSESPTQAGKARMGEPLEQQSGMVRMSDSSGQAGIRSEKLLDHYRDRLQYDPLRILLYDASGRLTGFELQRELERGQCWAEMSNSDYTLLIFGIGMTEETLHVLKKTIEEIHLRYKSEQLMGSRTEAAEKEGVIAEKERFIAAKEGFIATKEGYITAKEGYIAEKGVGISKPVLFSREIVDAAGPQTARVSLNEAAGRISAEMVVPYPPGIPLLYQGEVISEAIALEITRLAADGAKFQGAVDETMRTISILIEEKN